MFFFGHFGITLGAAVLFRQAQVRLSAPRREQIPAVEASPAPSNPEIQTPDRSPAHWTDSIDWRLVLFGSMLPDIIDKPVGTIIFADTFHNGRIFCHTLLFSLALLLLGLYFVKRKPQSTAILVVALGSMTHLVLDSMWRDPIALFWPLKGWEFRQLDLDNWIVEVFKDVFTNPSVFIPEIVGLAILAWFGLYLIKNDSMLNFIKTGRIARK